MFKAYMLWGQCGGTNFNIGRTICQCNWSCQCNWPCEPVGNLSFFLPSMSHWKHREINRQILRCLFNFKLIIISCLTLYSLMPGGIIWSPPDRHNGNDDTASSILKPPYRVIFWAKNIFIVPFIFYTFNDGFDLAIFIFLRCLY